MKISRIDKGYVKKYLEDGELVYYVIHKHWIEFVLTFIKWFIIGIIIPIFFMWLYPDMSLYLIGGMFFVLLMGLYDFFDWYLDVLILTDMNLIHAEWNGFFKSFATRIGYDTIGTVGFDKKSVLSSVFDYGDLIIDNGGEQIVFVNTTNPKKAEFQIIDAKNKYMGIGGDSDSDTPTMDKQGLKDLLSEIVAEEISKGSHKKGFGE